MSPTSQFELSTHALEEAQRALLEINGELGSVRFAPDDMETVEAAIRSAEAMIEAKLAPWAGNPLIAQLSDGIKGHYRQAIRQCAADNGLKKAK